MLEIKKFEQSLMVLLGCGARDAPQDFQTFRRAVPVGRRARVLAKVALPQRLELEDHHAERVDGA